MPSPTARLHALLETARHLAHVRVCVLAVDASTRGFGFVIFERTELADWGLVHVRRGDKNDGSIERLIKLIRRYSPDVLVVEDPATTGVVRSKRVRELLRRFRHAAEVHGLAVERIGWPVIRVRWCGDPRATKYQVAQVIAESLPMLRPRLPAKRKPWNSEDPRLTIFNAAAMAVTVLFPT